jgi:hypothetical protein
MFNNYPLLARPFERTFSISASLRRSLLRLIAKSRGVYIFLSSRRDGLLKGVLIAVIWRWGSIEVNLNFLTIIL